MTARPGQTPQVPQKARTVGGQEEYLIIKNAHISGLTAHGVWKLAVVVYLVRCTQKQKAAGTKRTLRNVEDLEA